MECLRRRLTGETSWKFPAVAEAVRPAAATSPSSIVASDAAEFAPSSEPPTSVVMAPPVYGNGGGRRAAPSHSSLSMTLGEGVLPRVLIISFCSLVTLISSSVEAGRIDKIRAARASGSAVGAANGTGVLDSVNVGASVATASLDGAAESFGIAVGSIAISFSVLLLLLAKRQPGTFVNWTLPKVQGDLSILQLYSLFMVVWWAAGAAVLTFFSPFTATCNAYFAIWGEWRAERTTRSARA